MNPDRALFLARTLVNRLRSLETALLDEADNDDQHEATARQSMVARVLAVEAGVVDGPTIQLVTSALPDIDLFRATTDREIDELAAFLRAQLPSSF